jgi:hypothetical protein
MAAQDSVAPDCVHPFDDFGLAFPRAVCLPRLRKMRKTGNCPSEALPWESDCTKIVVAICSGPLYVLQSVYRTYGRRENVHRT